MSGKRIVVALGGNAILRSKQLCGIGSVASALGALLGGRCLRIGRLRQRAGGSPRGDRRRRRPVLPMLNVSGERGRAFFIGKPSSPEILSLSEKSRQRR